VLPKTFTVLYAFISHDIGIPCLQLHGFAERYHPAVVLSGAMKSSAQQQMGIRAFLKEISTDNISTPKQG
jgi:hypothetical protein